MPIYRQSLFCGWSCLAITFALIVLLPGCGGGGSDSTIGQINTNSTATSPNVSTSSSATSVEGLWTGSSSYYSSSNGTTAFAAYTLLLGLENGEFWEVHAKTEDAFYYPNYYGLLHGTVAFSASNISGNFDRFYDDGTYAWPGSISGSTEAGPHLRWFTTQNQYGFSSTDFLMSLMPASLSAYTYSKPANIADITGTWFTKGSTESIKASTDSDTIQIKSDNTFSGIVGGCSFSGTLTPRGSRKNVFDSTVIFQTGSPCRLYNHGSGKGIAISYINKINKQQLMIAAITSDKKYGFAIYAQR